MVKLFYAKIETDISAALFTRLLAFLPDAEQTKIMKFMRFEDRLRGLFGKLLLCRILQTQCGVREFPTLFYDRYNRPYQKQVRDLDFNISHSGEWVACAITDTEKVGVDVEKIKPHIGSGIAEKYFSRAEITLLTHLPDDEKNRVFFHLWTLKEAYIKAEGSTFEIPLNAFWFDLSNPGYPTFQVADDFKYKTQCVFRSYPIENGYFMSACADSREKIPDAVQIPASELIGAGLRNN